MTRGHGPGNAECRAIFERLSEYLDGELSEDLCATVEEHVDDCSPCQAFLESLRRTVQLIRQVESPPLPDEIREAIHEAWLRYRRQSGRA